MRVVNSVIAQFGGLEELQKRVDAFRQALVDFRTTVGVPAPTEHTIVDVIARSGEAIEPMDDAEVPPGIPHGTIENVVERLNALEAMFAQRLTKLETRMNSIDLRTGGTLEPPEPVPPPPGSPPNAPHQATPAPATPALPPR